MRVSHIHIQEHAARARAHASRTHIRVRKRMHVRTQTRIRSLSSILGEDPITQKGINPYADAYGHIHERDLKVMNSAGITTIRTAGYDMSL